MLRRARFLARGRNERRGARRSYLPSCDSSGDFADTDPLREVEGIGATLSRIYAEANAEGIPTHVAAERLAAERLRAS